MKLSNTALLSSALLAASLLAACSSGSSSSSSEEGSNQPVLSVMPYQNLGESVLDCQQEEIGPGTPGLSVKAINSSGTLAFSTYSPNDIWGCSLIAFVGTTSAPVTQLEMESAWIYASGQQLFIDNPQTDSVYDISDNGVTVGVIEPIRTGPYTIMAAIGNTTSFVQVPIDNPIFNAESVNKSVYKISSNGQYALGAYNVYSEEQHSTPLATYSYIYNVTNESYNFNINTNQFGLPYSPNNPNMISINNNGVSVGTLLTNDTPLSQVGVYCNNSSSCNVIYPGTIDPDISPANITESQFGLYAINNNGVMLGQEDLTIYNSGDISSLYQIQFYNPGGALLGALESSYALVQLNTYVLTDDNVTIVQQNVTEELYFYSLNSNAFFDLIDVINQSTGWSSATAISNQVSIDGVSQDGHYIYGATNVASSSGNYRVPFTIYFKKGISYYLNNVYTPSSSIQTRNMNNSGTSVYRLGN